MPMDELTNNSNHATVLAKTHDKKTKESLSLIAFTDQARQQVNFCLSGRRRNQRDTAREDSEESRYI